MRNVLIHVFVVTAALGVTTWMLPGVRVESLPALFVGGLVLAMVNAWVRPLMVFVTFPITVLTLGLLLFVINGLAFALAAALVPGFTVAGFGWAIVGALVVSLVSLFLDRILDAPDSDQEERSSRG